jgi:alkylation response protein AidB-like acyl-CoA dehydrogenase
MTMTGDETREHPLVGQVREVGAQLAGAARQAELNRALPEEIVEILRDLGLFWLKTPDELGGTTLDPLDFCDVMEEVAYHDASAAWAVMIGCGTTGYLAGRLPDEGIAEMFVPGAPLPVAAGQFIPRGTATRVDGGYRVTGRWSFCSGIMHSDWVGGGFSAEDGQLRIHVVPKSEATVHDVWHVAGLQGTGSNDFSLTDHFVPDGRTMLTYDEPPKRGSSLHRQPPKLFVGNELGPLAVGVARRALDDMRETSRRPVSGMARIPLGDRATFQKTFAQCDAMVRAAQLLYRDAVAESCARFEEGNLDDGLMDIDMGRFVYANDLCIEAVRTLFRQGGGRVLHLEHPMQRHLRNLIAAGQHLFLSEENFELSGRALLGVPAERAA